MYNHFITFMNSVGQEFGQGLVGMAWWFHNVWGFSWEGPNSRTWLSSYKMEFSGVLGWLKCWTQMGLSAHLHVAFLHGLRSLPHGSLRGFGLCAWRLQAPKGSIPVNKAEAASLLRASLGSCITSLLPNSIGRSSHKLAQIQGEER